MPFWMMLWVTPLDNRLFIILSIGVSRPYVNYVSLSSHFIL